MLTTTGTRYPAGVSVGGDAFAQCPAAFTLTSLIAGSGFASAQVMTSTGSVFSAQSLESTSSSRWTTRRSLVQGPRRWAPGEAMESAFCAGVFNACLRPFDCVRDELRVEVRQASSNLPRSSLDSFVRRPDGRCHRVQVLGYPGGGQVGEQSPLPVGSNEEVFQRYQQHRRHAGQAEKCRTKYLQSSQGCVVVSGL